MKHARDEVTNQHQKPETAGTDRALVLDDDAVLEILEPGLSGEHSIDPIIGIRNGVLLGSLIWLAVLTGIAFFV